MTHEEKAREIALWLYGPDEGMSEGLVRTLIDKITEALASAEKKGREEGSLSHTMTYHQGKKEGWNEAITAAVKVAEDDDNIVTCDGANSYYCQLGDASATSTKIASKIEALRKG